MDYINRSLFLFKNIVLLGNEYIVIIFSVITPVILLIGSLSFALLWIAYRYLFLYVNRLESKHEGRLYPSALFQLFTGLYVL
jgi:hypothetical protein